jgi:arylsulfatase A-like enzyme
VVTDLARSLDIAPTILEAAGVPIPATMMGRRLRDASEPPSYAFAEEDHEGNVLQSLRTASHKLILANPDNPRGLPAQSLFDLQADPGEHRDLLPDRPELVGPLQESLRQVLLAALEKAVDSEVGALDPNLQDKLHDLGY